MYTGWQERFVKHGKGGEHHDKAKAACGVAGGSSGFVHHALFCALHRCRSASRLHWRGLPGLHTDLPLPKCVEKPFSCNLRCGFFCCACVSFQKDSVLQQVFHVEKLAGYAQGEALGLNWNRIQGCGLPFRQALRLLPSPLYFCVLFQVFIISGGNPNEKNDRAAACAFDARRRSCRLQ